MSEASDEQVAGDSDPSKPASSLHQLSIKVWNWMGGEIQWAALPYIADIFEIEDVEALVLDLVVIRNWNQLELDRKING